MKLFIRSTFALAVLCGPALAQKANEGPTYISREQADEDFAFAGEYLGWQKLQGSDRGSQRIGVQVIPLGGGKFTAVKYLGGLPGDGWMRGQRILLDGERTTDVVALKGHVTSLVVAPEE